MSREEEKLPAGSQAKRANKKKKSKDAAQEAPICKEQQHQNISHLFEKLPQDIAIEYAEYLKKFFGSKFVEAYQSKLPTHHQERRTKAVNTKCVQNSPPHSSESLSQRCMKSENSKPRFRPRCSRKPKKNSKQTYVVEDEEHVGGSESPTFEDIKPFKCDICGVQFSTKETHNQHIVKFHKIKRFKCLICSENFLHKTDMHKHVKTHAGPEGLECSVCLKTYKIFSSFLQHMNRVHLKDLQLPCPECGLTFRNRWLLRSHSLVHSKMQKFVCPICNKGFRVKTWFLDHLNSHCGFNPYRCVYCSKCFRKQSTLRDHIKLHDNGMKHLCSVCKKQFITPSLLKKHARVHETKKKFECKECGMKFKLPQTLVSHRLVHKGSNSKDTISSLNVLNSNSVQRGDLVEMEEDSASESEDSGSGEMFDFSSTIEGIEVNRNPLDLGTGLLDILKKGIESESESESENEEVPKGNSHF